MRRVRVSIVGLLVVVTEVETDVAGAVSEVRRERDAAVCVARATVVAAPDVAAAVALGDDGALDVASEDAAGMGLGPAWT